MKSANKVLLINLAVAVLITIVGLFYFGSGSARDVAVGFGVVCLLQGLGNLLFGLLLLITDRKTVRDGWLLTGAICCCLVAFHAVAE